MFTDSKILIFLLKINLIRFRYSQPIRYLNGDRDIDLLNACFKADTGFARQRPSRPGFLEGQPGPLYSPRPLGALLFLVAAGSTILYVFQIWFNVKSFLTS